MHPQIVQLAARLIAKSLAGGVARPLAAGAALAALPMMVGAQPPAAPAPGPAPQQAREDALRERPVADRDDVKIVEQRGGRIPLDLVFRDESGNIVPLSRWFNQGRPVVVILMYFRCPLMCPQTISSLLQAVNGTSLQIGKDYNLLIVSFDPTEGPGDAAAQRLGVLGQYQHPSSDATEQGLAVLTDTANNARALANALGFGYKFIPSTQQYSHMNVGFVLTQDGTISQYLKGVNYGGATLKGALIEAGEGRVGDLIDRVAQWCMVFDPATGRYQLMATRVMKIGASAAAVLTLGVVALAVRADRRRRRRHAAEAATAGSPGLAGAAAGGHESTVPTGGATGRHSDMGLTS